MEMIHFGQKMFFPFLTFCQPKNPNTQKLHLIFEMLNVNYKIGMFYSEINLLYEELDM